MIRPSRQADRIEKNRLRALRRAEREDMIRVIGGDDDTSPPSAISGLPQAPADGNDGAPRSRI